CAKPWCISVFTVIVCDPSLCSPELPQPFTEATTLQYSTRWHSADKASRPHPESAERDHLSAKNVVSRVTTRSASENETGAGEMDITILHAISCPLGATPSTIGCALPQILVTTRFSQ